MNECRSWVYEPCWSKTGPSKEIVGECKYSLIASEVDFQLEKLVFKEVFYALSSGDTFRKEVW